MIPMYLNKRVTVTDKNHPKYGKIGILSYTSFGSDGTRAGIIWSDDSTKEEIPPENIIELEDETWVTMSEQILSFIKNECPGIGSIIKRRLDPDYFKLGKLVYISAGGIFRDWSGYAGEQIGPEHPYRICSIQQCQSKNDPDGLHLNFIVRICSPNINDWENTHEWIAEFRCSLDKFYSNDGYHSLVRYDKLY